MRRRTAEKRRASSSPSGGARKTREATRPPAAATMLPDVQAAAKRTSDRAMVADIHRMTSAHAARATSIPRCAYWRKE